MASARGFGIFISTIALSCLGSGVCQIVVDHERGQNLSLKCDVPGAVNSITWKHGNDKIVEWSEGDEEPEWYKSQGFKGVLNTKNGDVQLVKLDKDGKFTCEILLGSTVNSKFKQVVLWDKPLKPEVTCESNGTNIILNCLVNTKARETVEWSGPNVVKGTDKTLVYPKNLNEESVFFCSAVNPVGATGIEFRLVNCKGRSSDEPNDGINPTIPIVIVILVLIVLGAALAYWKRNVWVPMLPISKENDQARDVNLAEQKEKMNAEATYENMQDPPQ